MFQGVHPLMTCLVCRKWDNPSYPQLIYIGYSLEFNVVELDLQLFTSKSDGVLGHHRVT